MHVRVISLVFTLLFLSNSGAAKVASMKQHHPADTRVMLLCKKYCGSAFFLEVDRSNFLITNEHVTEQIGKKVSYIHEMFDDFFSVRSLFAKPFFSYEFDIAGWRIPKHASFEIAKRSPRIGDRIKIVGFEALGQTLASFEYSGYITAFSQDNRIVFTTDAGVSIFNGASGSPVIDAFGKVIGVFNSSLDGRMRNLNFAVPIDILVKSLAKVDFKRSLLFLIAWLSVILRRQVVQRYGHEK